MELTSITKELTNLLSLVKRWEEQGYTPKIELDIAKKRTQKLYESFLEQSDNELPSSSPYVEQFIESDNTTKTPSETAQPPQEIENPNPTTLVEEGVETRNSHEDQRFIDELFSSDSEYYYAEYAKIDAMPLLDDMLIYISENYSWHHNSAVAQEFVSKLIEKHS